MWWFFAVLCVFFFGWFMVSLWCFFEFVWKSHFCLCFLCDVLRIFVSVGRSPLVVGFLSEKDETPKPGFA